jgi:hypothetical protein
MWKKNLLCHMSQSRTIINNHNRQWKLMFFKKLNFMFKNLHSAMRQILIYG